MQRVVCLVDGWFFNRAFFRRGQPLIHGASVLKYCQRHLLENDRLFRVYYYDTEPFSGVSDHPVSGQRIEFKETKVAKDQFRILADLKRTMHVDVRLGRTIFDNEWIIKPELTHPLLNGTLSPQDITPANVKPSIRQKGVDMMLGLDLASLVLKRIVDRVVIISADSDIAPAAQFSRNEGVQVTLDPLDAEPGIHLEASVDVVQTFFEDHLAETSCAKIVATP